MDRLHPFYSILTSSLILIVVWAIETGAGGITVAAVIITCFGIDVFRQMQQVSLTNWVFGLEQDARARLNAILLLSVSMFHAEDGSFDSSFIFFTCSSFSSVKSWEPRQDPKSLSIMGGGQQLD